MEGGYDEEVVIGHSEFDVNFLSRSTSRFILVIPAFLALGTYFGEISSHYICALD